MLNRRILRVKAMQALYGYHLAIESLREIAGLQTIDLMVPVTFDLTFKDR